MRKTAVILLLSLSGAVAAQDSTSYKIQPATLNEGGRPAEGIHPASSGYQVTLDSIGGAFSSTLSSPSFVLAGGFANGCRPAGEVQELGFTSDGTTLKWTAEPSASHYNLYRGLVPVFAPDFGACNQSSLPATSTTDSTEPATGQSYFYLVTAVNCLGEEGTKGGGVPNPSPCP